MSHSRHRAGAWLALVLGFLAAGCGHKTAVLAPDASASAPALSLSAERVATGKPGITAFRVRWNVTGGIARRFVYALNPLDRGRVDGGWKATTEPSVLIEVPLRERTAVGGVNAQGVTTIVVRAEDGRGRMSEPATLSFADGNVLPTVRIFSPSADWVQKMVPASVVIRWIGTDPDGLPRMLPAEFRWKLLTASTAVSYPTALAHPDSVRRYYEPGGYADWTVAGVGHDGDGSVSPGGLVVGQDYIFVVVAKDQEGAWNPFFSLGGNMLNFHVVPNGTTGPVLTVYNASFFYQYADAAYSTDPGREIAIRVAPRTRFPIRWSASVAVGASITGYRWGLDLSDPTSDEPRDQVGGGRTGWSRPDPSRTSVELGPFGPNETHRLYIEAQDSEARRSLGIVRIETFGAEKQRSLLVVNDTRYALDQRPAGTDCVSRPAGRWPVAAELDSFLFARGGFPWKCYPPGTRSTPGLFAGYDFDTMGTRGLPNGEIPLSVLSRYRRVVWLVDQRAASMTGPSSDPAGAMSALRAMSQPGRQNALAEFARAGGEVWIAGGGGLTAATLPYDLVNNNTAAPAAGLTFDQRLGELGPGRLAYDVAGWQSQIKVSSSLIQIRRFLGRYEHQPNPSLYSELPAGMQPKSPANDPFPPNRTFVSGDFYVSSFDVEYLSSGNYLVNSPRLGGRGPAGSTLDTLYRALGVALMPPSFNFANVCMTRNFGEFRNNPVIMTGFDFWHFRRDDCKAMVDFVLQRLWGMEPEAVVIPAPRLAHASP